MTGKYVIETFTRSGKAEIVGALTGTRRQARVVRNQFRKQNHDQVYHERWIGPDPDAEPQ